MIDFNILHFFNISLGYQPVRINLRFPLTKDSMYLDALFKAVWRAYHTVPILNFYTCLKSSK